MWISSTDEHNSTTAHEHGGDGRLAALQKFRMMKYTLADEKTTVENDCSQSKRARAHPNM
jgi:hypothetical protein